MTPNVRALVLLLATLLGTAIGGGLAVLLAPLMFNYGIPYCGTLRGCTDVAIAGGFITATPQMVTAFTVITAAASGLIALFFSLRFTRPTPAE